MKQRVTRLSPHQNGKVVAVAMAAVLAVFVVPFALIFFFVMPTTRHDGPSLPMFLLLPAIYLVVGYLSTAIGCGLYNTIVRYVGGFEYESRPVVEDARR